MTEREIIIRTVAATLREIASWSAEPLAAEYRSVANEVEGDLSWTCPVCQEVLCDSDCPLAPVRGDDSGNPGMPAEQASTEPEAKQ